MKATLTLPQPCAESWDAMTPTTGGRHCAACAKTVVDFTALTDAGVLAYLAGVQFTACGRFRADQLGRALHPAATPVAGWRRWLGALAALLGLGSLATPVWAQLGQGVSQGKPARPAATQHPARPQLLGQPARPASTATGTRLPHVAPPSAPLLLGEPVVTGAPQVAPARPTTKPRKQAPP